jgi:hypothetical protein
VLPPAVVDALAATVEDAVARGLPGRAVANLALEGVAKGRGGEEVRAAVRALVGELEAARTALEAGGRVPGVGEIETAALAVRLGLDGAAVSALAASSPSGRSLVIPLAVAGQLAQRRLPSDHAIALVQERLRVADCELIGLPEEVDRVLAQGTEPGNVGAALAAALTGFNLPIPMIGIPTGVPAGVPANGGFGERRPGPPGVPPGRSSTPTPGGFKP